MPWGQAMILIILLREETYITSLFTLWKRSQDSVQRWTLETEKEISHVFSLKKAQWCFIATCIVLCNYKQ